MVKDKYQLAWINDWIDQFWEVRVMSKNWLWSQVFDLKEFGGYGENVKFKSRSEWAFDFLRYLMVLRFLNDPNGLVLDFILSKLFEV